MLSEIDRTYTRDLEYVDDSDIAFEGNGVESMTAEEVHIPRADAPLKTVASVPACDYDDSEHKGMIEVAAEELIGARVEPAPRTMEAPGEGNGVFSNDFRSQIPKNIWKHFRTLQNALPRFLLEVGAEKPQSTMDTAPPLRPDASVQPSHTSHTTLLSQRALVVPFGCKDAVAHKSVLENGIVSEQAGTRPDVVTRIGNEFKRRVAILVAADYKNAPLADGPKRAKLVVPVEIVPARNVPHPANRACASKLALAFDRATELPSQPRRGEFMQDAPRQGKMFQPERTLKRAAQSRPQDFAAQPTSIASLVGTKTVAIPSPDARPQALCMPASRSVSNARFSLPANPKPFRTSGETKSGRERVAEEVAPHKAQSVADKPQPLYSSEDMALTFSDHRSVSLMDDKTNVSEAYHRTTGASETRGHCIEPTANVGLEAVRSV